MASNSKPRKFSQAPRGPQKSHFGEQKAAALVLRMVWCNHGLMGDFMGAFYRPLYPLKPDVLWGPPGLSGGQAPSGTT